MKVIRTYDNYLHAHMAIGQLAEHNIPAFLQDEFTVTIDPVLSNAVGGIKLVVSNREAVRAENILFDYEAADKRMCACPQCSSTQVEHIATATPKNWLTAILSFLFASYAVPMVKKYHCFGCGHEFEELPVRPEPEQTR